MVVSMIPHHRPHPPVRQVALSHALIWMLVLSFILPPSLLAQNLPPQVAPPGMMQQSPRRLALLIVAQAIVTNPTALQPIVPTQTPCPTPLSSDLSSKGTVPNLNDYWPVEPSSLLPSSIEQRMKQEQEERDRRQEKLQAEKEKSSIEYQVQVEREKKGVSQLPFGQGVVPSLQQPAAQAQGQPGARPNCGALSMNCSVSRISMWKKPLPSFLCCTA